MDTAMGSDANFKGVTGSIPIMARLFYERSASESDAHFNIPCRIPWRIILGRSKPHNLYGQHKEQ